MADEGRIHEQAKKLNRLFYQTKKSLCLLRNVAEIYDCIKPAFNIFAGYETNHENPSFSIDDAKDVTANVLILTPTIGDPKYYNNINKQIIWLRRITN